MPRQQTMFTPVTVEQLRASLSHFAQERQWEKFHTPRNLLLALVGEVGELSEIFQWRGEVAANLPDFSDAEKQHVGQELSDVLLYLIRLADVCGIDLGKAALNKLALNAVKYPADKCRGRSDKYTAYTQQGGGTSLPHTHSAQAHQEQEGAEQQRQQHQQLQQQHRQQRNQQPTAHGPRSPAVSAASSGAAAAAACSAAVPASSYHQAEEQPSTALRVVPVTPNSCSQCDLSLQPHAQPADHDSSLATDSQGGLLGCEHEQSWQASAAAAAAAAARSSDCVTASNPVMAPCSACPYNQQQQDRM